MDLFFSYVQYSQAELQWSWQYATISLIGCMTCIGLWIGYRNNKINDDKRRMEKQAHLQENQDRLKRIASLYPKKAKN